MDFSMTPSKPETRIYRVIIRTVTIYDDWKLLSNRTRRRLALPLLYLVNIEKYVFPKFFYVVEQKKSFPPYGDYYWKLDLLRYNRQSKDTESKTSMPQWAKKLGGKYFDIFFFAPQTTSRLLGLKKNLKNVDFCICG